MPPHLSPADGPQQPSIVVVRHLANNVEHYSSLLLVVVAGGWRLLLGGIVLGHEHHVLRMMLWLAAAGKVLGHELRRASDERAHHLEVGRLRLRLRVLRGSAASGRWLGSARMVLRLVLLMGLAGRRRGRGRGGR